MNANTLSQEEIDALLEGSLEEKSSLDFQSNPSTESQVGNLSENIATASEEKQDVNDLGKISFLHDIPMTLTVELGRTKKKIEEVLEIEKGSIIELDRLAGEAVDLFINGKLFAKGEVVVVDDNFGIRVVNIVKPKERLESLDN